MTTWMMDTKFLQLIVIDLRGTSRTRMNVDQRVFLRRCGYTGARQTPCRDANAHPIQSNLARGQNVQT